jgi:hypothetical protein
MKLSRIPSIILLIVIILLVHLPAAWAGDNTASNVTPPGAEKSNQTKMLETGAKALQSKAPISAMNVYVDGFHFHNGDMNRQVEAHHYCNVINEDLIQCAIYDSNSENARLMGIEYIVSEKIFQTLPQDEKKLWHSHAYEVKSGQLLAPNIPDLPEHELMEKLASTYGKTWHTWQTDQSNMTLPLGSPELMMGFTADGQINPAVVQERDRRLNISIETKKQNRADILTPSIQPGADAWQTGQTVQLQLVPLSNVGK